MWAERIEMLLTFSCLEENVGHSVDPLGRTFKKTIRRSVGTPDLGLALVGGSVDLDTGKVRHGCSWRGW